MTTATRELTIHRPRPHSGQLTIFREARRFNVVACGRRFGKTTAGIDLLIGPALAGKPVAWFAPTHKMMTEVWREACQSFAPAITRMDAQQHRLDLRTGGVIEMWSLERADAARGRKYARAIIDEAAMVRDLENAWLAVIRPTLTDYQGDAWFLSTPRGLNFFHTLYQWGQDPERADWRSWLMPTTANPYIIPAEVDAARHDLPERIFAQEYLATFLDFEGAVFRHVLDAATAEPQAAALPGHRYVVGVDWGKLVDFTVFTVIDVTMRALVCLDRFNQIDYAVQTGRLTTLLNRFRPTTIIPEYNSMGVPLVEQLQRQGLPIQPFTTTNATKAAAIDALALAFERGELRILNDPVLIGELTAYEAERLPSGLLRYGAPAGLHDDCVMALALAWQALIPDATESFWNALAARSDTCPACGRASLVRQTDETWTCHGCGYRRLA